MHFMKDSQTGNYLRLTPKGYVSRKAIGSRVTLYNGAPATIADVVGKRIMFVTREGQVSGCVGYIIAIG